MVAIVLHPPPVVCVMSISTAARKGNGMFDDDIYDTLKNDMAHSRDGVYDNLPAGETLPIEDIVRVYVDQ